MYKEVIYKKNILSCEQVWPGRDPRDLQPGPGRYPATAENSNIRSHRTKHPIKMTFASWNVCTLLDLDKAKRSERRTALVSRELARYNIDIAALSETRISEEGQFVESSGYTFFLKGLPEGERRQAGVGFAIRSSLVNHVNELPNSFSERIISCRLALKNGRFMTVVSIYAPTMSHPPEEIEKFYADLGNIVANIPKDDKIAILGDFNARVGSDHNTWTALGRHGLEKCNRNGLSLLTFCTEHNFVISSSFFQQKDKYKSTWMHPRSKHWHLLDYVLVRSRDIQDVHSVRTTRGAECWTDHRLVRAKLGLVVAPKHRKQGSTLPKRINVSLLKNPETATQFQVAIQSIPPLDPIDPWSQFRDTAFEASSNVLGFKKRKTADWFDDNDHKIANLLEQKHDLHNKLLCCTRNLRVALFIRA